MCGIVSPATVLNHPTIFISVYGAVPYTITDEEYLKATIQRLIDHRVGPIEGFTSNYDYEKGQWKK